MKLSDISQKQNIQEVRNLLGRILWNKFKGMFPFIGRKPKAKAQALSIVRKAFKKFDLFLGRRDMDLSNVTWKVLYAYMISPQGLRMNSDRVKDIITNPDLKNAVQNAWTTVGPDGPKYYAKNEKPIGGDSANSKKYAAAALESIFLTCALEYLETRSEDKTKLSSHERKWLEKQGFDPDLFGAGSSYNNNKIAGIIDRGIEGDETADDELRALLGKGAAKTPDSNVTRLNKIGTLKTTGQNVNLWLTSGLVDKLIKQLRAQRNTLKSMTTKPTTLPIKTGYPGLDKWYMDQLNASASVQDWLVMYTMNIQSYKKIVDQQNIRVKNIINKISTGPSEFKNIKALVGRGDFNNNHKSEIAKALLKSQLRRDQKNFIMNKLRGYYSIAENWRFS